MNNTEKLKSLLQQAIQAAPDFALQEVRYHILKAMSLVEKATKKENKRITQDLNKQWQETLQGSLNNPYTSLATLKTIETMLGTEYKKLKELNERKAAKDVSSDDGLQNLHD